MRWGGPATGGGTGCGRGPVRRQVPALHAARLADLRRTHSGHEASVWPQAADHPEAPDQRIPQAFRPRTSHLPRGNRQQGARYLPADAHWQRLRLG